MRTTARLLAAALACTVIALACADAGETERAPVPVLETPATEPLAAGQSCGPTVACAPGLFCSRGVCCTTPCTQACWSCLASEKADGSSSGTCGPSKLGSAPLGDCFAHGLFPSPECAANQCNGHGVCALPVNTDCDAVCAGDLLQKYTCNDLGKCKSQPIDCGHYTCGNGKCFTNCDFDDDSKCAVGNFCRAGQCVPPQPNGVACATNDHCVSGHCVDGVCCASACDGPCMTCLAKDKSSGIDGDCGEVKQKTVSLADCGAPAPPCGTDGTCDGTGKCAFFPDSKACGGATCQPAPVGGTAEITGLLCDGSGQCLDATATHPCTGYAVCGQNGECPTSCTDNIECSTGYACFKLFASDALAQCAKKLLAGNCSDHEQCDSGYCYDGHCCDAPCGGTCQSCETGTCKTLVGAPVGAKAQQCPGGTLAEPCLARECDGKAVESCEGFVGAAVACRPASCADGVKTLAGTCDGLGHCEPPVLASCDGFACDGLECKTTCATNDDCASDAVCDPTSGKCAKGSHCVDEIWLKDLNGALTDCSPFRCVGGACVEACTSNDTCADGFLCDHASGDCVPSPVAADVEPVGCWCTTGRTRGGDELWLLGVALGMALALRRSRRR